MALSSQTNSAMGAFLNHIPNALTWSRILAVPVIIALFQNHAYLAAIVLTVVASLTDFFDGKTARALNRVTVFGSILDPVADKVMILSLFGLLTTHGIVPIWFFAIALLRNVSQLMSIPILMWWKKIAFNVKPKMIPKFASALSYVIILMGLLTFTPLASLGEAYWRSAIYLLCSVLAVLEAQILVTYCPRFLQIYRGTHDTFE